MPSRGRLKGSGIIMGEIDRQNDWWVSGAGQAWRMGMDGVRILIWEFVSVISLIPSFLV